MDEHYCKTCCYCGEETSVTSCKQYGDSVIVDRNALISLSDALGSVMDLMRNLNEAIGNQEIQRLQNQYPQLACLSKNSEEKVREFLLQSNKIVNALRRSTGNFKEGSTENLANIKCTERRRGRTVGRRLQSTYRKTKRSFRGVRR